VQSAGGRVIAGVYGRGYVEECVVEVIGVGGKRLVNGDEVLMLR
jgi:hypothetical protein